MNKLDKVREKVEAAILPPAREPFIETRYPYTYSADFLRSHIDIIPKKYLKTQAWVEDMGLSRAQAAGIKFEWAKDLEVDERELACVFADAYLAEHQIGWK